MPKKRTTRRYQVPNEMQEAPSEPLEKQKLKGPSDLNIEVRVNAPWGVHNMIYTMKNPQGNIPRPKQNEKTFYRAIWEGLKSEFGGLIQ